MLLLIVLVLNALVTPPDGTAAAAAEPAPAARRWLEPAARVGRLEAGRDGPADAAARAADRARPRAARVPPGERRDTRPRRGEAPRRAARRAPAVSAAPARSQVRERMRDRIAVAGVRQNWVVRDVSLPVRQGEVLALIGASGSGKTTLLRSLNRLTEVTAGAARSGHITLDGQDIHELEVNDLRRRVTMVFQQPNPFPMSIFDNVAYAIVEGARRAAFAAAGAARSSSEP